MPDHIPFQMVPVACVTIEVAADLFGVPPTTVQGWLLDPIDTAPCIRRPGRPRMIHVGMLGIWLALQISRGRRRR